MKVCKVSLFLALLVAVCLPAAGQSRIRLDIPFDFTVAGKSLPAGQYTLSPVFGSTDTDVWQICSYDHGCAAVFTHPEESTRSAHHTSMVFLNTSEGYALVQFWSDEHLGRDLAAPNVEHTLMAQREKYVEIGAK